MAKKSAEKFPVSVKPTGVTITRADNVFTASWKFGDKNYDRGQALQYRINGSQGKWVSVAIGETVTAKTFLTVNYANYYPNPGKPALIQIEVRVKGRRGPYIVETKKKITHYIPSDSQWSYYTYKFTVPTIASLTATPTDGVANECTFAWNTNDAGTNKLQKTEWKAILLPESNLTAGKAAFSLSGVSGQEYSGTGGKTGSWTKAETYTPSAAGIPSYTRWFRVRAYGVCGVSAWKCVKCVYALPYTSIIDKLTGTKTASGYTVDATWRSPDSNGRPIDTTTFEYAIDSPDAGMACPSGASWTTAKTLRDIRSGSNTTSFTIDDAPDDNECLFVRVDNHFRSFDTPGIPTLVPGAVGALSSPTIDSLTASSPTITIEATNTAESDVADSFLVVRLMDNDNPDGYDIAIIESDTVQPVTITVPAWDSGSPPLIGVYAVVGTATADTSSTYDRYIITDIQMRSEMVTQGGTIPAAPANVDAVQTDIPGTVRVTWDWTWSDATGMELSWADHKDAWESTDEPETYEITAGRPSAWNISGLDTGVTWYIRVRLFIGGNDPVYGAYSEIVPIDLSSAPSIPVLTLTPAVVTRDGNVTASWTYVTKDGTMQAGATVAIVTEVSGTLVYSDVAATSTAQYVSIDAAEWQTGETYALAVKVLSESGAESEWSEPVTVAVAEPMTCSITDTSLEEETVTDDTVSRLVNSLKEMPLTVTVEGAGDYGTTTVMIVRTVDYAMDRPDESQFIGYAGETIALITQVGEAEITIDADTLIGHLDDGAMYRIVATVQDGLGQTADDFIDFEVHWTHQAVAPEATVEIDEDNGIAILTPIEPDGAAAGDVCDIYRLSVDRPQLIIPAAIWGTDYVDPYPAIGENGGYRFVLRTANGDYITDDNELAWTDVREEFESEDNIIEFGTGAIRLRYNVDLSSAWTKDFSETKYLGGSVQGDWNPAVSRASSVTSVVIAEDDQETIEAMRRLATWAGICHIRTKDGSSYAADVQVSEKYAVAEGHKLATFDLKITRVDAESYDGLTLAEWEQTHEEEEE